MPAIPVHFVQNVVKVKIYQGKDVIKKLPLSSRKYYLTICFRSDEISALNGEPEVRNKTERIKQIDLSRLMHVNAAKVC